MAHMYITLLWKKNAFHKLAVNVASYETFLLKDLRISMASLLKYFNPCSLLG